MKRNAIAWAALIVSTAALISSQAVTRTVPAAPEVPAEGQKAAQALSSAFEAVADFIKPSVVQISVRRKAGARNPSLGRRLPSPEPGNPQQEMPKEFEDMLKRFFGPEARPEREQFGPRVEGTGSGFVFDDKGHILTNNHVVEDSDKVVVTFHDGTEANATVVGTDPASDVAVIKVENTEYRPVLKGVSKALRVGEWVMAVGSPFGLDQTVTAGIVSATERNEVGINDYESFIQTDASINPGNSGGPLVDMSGRVVGINSAIMTGSRSNAGVGFAIPMDMASALAEKLIRDGKVSRARLGVVLGLLTPALAEKLGADAKTHGTIVSEVVPGSPAAKAGLEQGDIIIAFDGNPVLGRASLRNLVAASDVGKSYNLGLVRDGKDQTITVVPAGEDEVVFEGLQPRRSESSPSKPEAPKAEFEDFGLAVQAISPDLAAQLGHAKDAKGLVVTSVEEGSPAEAAGLEEGELITKVIRDKAIQSVQGLDEFKELVGKSKVLGLFVQAADAPGRFVTLSRPEAK